MRGLNFGAPASIDQAQTRHRTSILICVLYVDRKCCVSEGPTDDSLNHRPLKLQRFFCNTNTHIRI